jgi:hypothetical protein
MKLNDLGLSIPILISSSKLSITLEKDAFLTWRAKLPMADTGKTAKEIYNVLINLNHSACDPIKRFDLLEIINPSLQLICLTLSKHFLNQTTALDNQKQSIANLAKTLQTEHANGYKLVLTDFLKQKLPLTDVNNQTILAKTIKRCIQNFENVIFRLYELYTSPPDGIWKEIHILYQLAKKLNLLNIEVEPSKATKEHIKNILEIYLHVLILAATDPYQLRQKDQEVLFKAIFYWFTKVKLTTVENKPKDLSSAYILDPNLDTPLIALSAQVAKENNNCLILDLSELTTHIKSILKELETNELKTRIQHENEAEYNVSIQSLKKLIKGWSTIKIRNANRFTVSMNMRACVGFSAVYYFLNNQAEFAAASSISDQLMDLGVEEIKETIESSKYKIHACSTTNISPFGLCMLWDEGSHPPIQSGEIIGIQPEYEVSKTSWNVGVVRWLRHDSNNVLKIGIEMLSANATVASIQLIRDGAPSGQYLRCLILSNIPIESQEKSIITPPMPFKSNHNVIIKFDDKTEEIKTKLVTELNSTGAFKQFSLTVKEKSIDDKLEKKKEVTPDTTNKDQNKKSEEDNNSEFGNLWDKL